MKSWHQLKKFRPSKALLGKIGEALVANSLTRKGYFIWQKDWKSARGQLDLITSRDRTLTIVEVKTRFAPSKRGLAQYPLTRKQAQRIARSATHFQKVFLPELHRARIRKIELMLAEVHILSVFPRPRWSIHYSQFKK